MARLVQRIEEDADAPRMIIERLKILEREEAELALVNAATETPKVVRLPANYDRVCRQAVVELELHLRSPDGAKAREAIRLLINKVVVQEGDQRGGKHRDIQLHGDLL